LKLLLAFVAAALLQLALKAAHVWWLLAACQPLLLVVLATARRYRPTTVAWIGMGIGLLADVAADRILGPGGIAGAVAGAVVASVVRRFELEGPLFWTVGSLLVTACSETAWLGVETTLGVRPEHGFLGTLAAVITTAAAGLVVAATERGIKAWHSPERTRRRDLKRL
jgi:rod shape-determining protein MreD